MSSSAVTEPPTVAPHLQIYSPQQLQQLDALASAHRVAYQHYFQPQQSSANLQLATLEACAAQQAPIDQSVATLSLPPAFVLPPNEQRLVNLIATLSSQHHLSDYSKLKLGDRGYAPPYVPLSITVPGHVEELRQRQAHNVAQTCVFLARLSSPNGSDDNVVDLTPRQEVIIAQNLIEARSIPEAHIPLPSSLSTTPLPSPSLGSPPLLLRSHSAPSLQPPPSPLLQQALDLALSSQLVLPPSPTFMVARPQARPAVPLKGHLYPLALPSRAFNPVVANSAPSTPKTSDSHPINISYLIPPEYIPFISAHISNAYPHFIDQAPLSGSTDADPFSQEHPGRISQFFLPPHLRFDGFVHNQPSGPPSPLVSASPSHPRTASSPRSAQRPQSRGEDRPWPARSTRSSFGAAGGKYARPTSASGTSPTVTFSSSEADIQQAIADALLPFKIDQDQTPTVDSAQSVKLATTRSMPGLHDEAPLASLPFPLTGTGNAAQEAVLTPPPPPIPSSPGYFSAQYRYPSPQPAPLAPQIGNLLLSSCPGKKVRLTGPIKGRGAICRSLPQDLARIQSLGVGLIINCLDDIELEFLGAPWSQYVECANGLGLDVLRIPTPEGLAPLNTRRLDEQLDWVIREYTLKGLNVLVHCRGGVGRAGLVACCWMMKMGLCGPVDESIVLGKVATDSAQPLSWASLIEQGLVRSETFHLIQRVVITIRRRRSVKAIETYEQARFLFDFAEHLRECQLLQAAGSASSNLATPTDSEMPMLVVPETGTTIDREKSPVPSIGQMSVATTDNTLVDAEETTPEDPQAVGGPSTGYDSESGAVTAAGADSEEDLNRSESELSTPRGG